MYKPASTVCSAAGSLLPSLFESPLNTSAAVSADFWNSERSWPPTFLLFRPSMSKNQKKLITIIFSLEHKYLFEESHLSLKICHIAFKILFPEQLFNKTRLSINYNKKVKNRTFSLTALKWKNKNLIVKTAKRKRTC